MKIIGIFGGSGSGKTTATKILKEKINNSFILVMDPLMHKHWEEHKEEILNAINVKEVGDTWWRTYVVSSIETIKKSIDIIKPGIEKDFKKFIKENKSYDAIIVDWAFLPFISCFNDCDITISISTDFETKIKRLSSRLDENNKLQRWPKEALIGRITNTDLTDLGYTAKYNINNNGTLEELINNISKILLEENIEFSDDIEEKRNIHNINK